MSNASIQRNTILYSPGGDKAADRVKHRLGWLAYGADIVPEESPKLDAKMIQVQLIDLHGAAFNDVLRFETLVNSDLPKKQIQDPIAIIVPKPLKKPAIVIEPELPKMSDEKTVTVIVPEASKKSDEKTATVIEPEMVAIPSGKFLMGSPKTEASRSSDEDPQHEVTIAYAFEISKFEVTFDEYDAFANATKRKLPDDRGWGRGKRPVVNVSFNDAQAYVKWLSDQTGKQYRLPTEAEWEYTARAGTQTAYWWGDNIGKNNAVCDSCGSEWDGNQTAPVGSFKPNRFGLHDTAGNVWEWVEDCWHENYHNAPTDGSAWKEANGGDCGHRVVRGGSWDGDPLILRSADRFRSITDVAYGILGFRIARAF